MSDPGSRDALERMTRMRAAAREAGGTWPAKRELAAALRALLEELPHTAAADETLRAAAAAVREGADAFAAAGSLREVDGDRRALFAGMENFQDTSPVVGLANPIAPPLEFSVDVEAGVVRGRGTFGNAYEGAPGCLHGGVLSCAIDELLGLATSLSGGPGMTAELTIRYRKPTPVRRELVFEGRLDRVEGRRLFVSADVHAGDVRTADAKGLFIAVDAAKFESFEAARKRGA